MSAHIYRGWRDASGNAHVKADFEDLPLRLDLDNHSPTGYASLYDEKEGHGLKLNKEQAISRQKAVIHQAKQRVADEEQTLAIIESNEADRTWFLDATLDPWE